MRSTFWATNKKRHRFAEHSGVHRLLWNVEVSKLAGGSSEDTMNAASNAPVKRQKKRIQWLHNEGD